MDKHFGREKFLEAMAGCEDALRVWALFKGVAGRQKTAAEEIVRPRKYSDPKFDNEDYMASVEESLIKSLGLQVDTPTAKPESQKQEGKKPQPKKGPRKFSD